MQADIHPNYQEIQVTCSCGSKFTTRSTMAKPLQIEVCSSCHPFRWSAPQSRPRAAFFLFARCPTSLRRWR
ncbi:MAG: 50S ribosomal protein L31 [Betaproteobacteria bacterium]|nr:50S ribosomal protein L31 [Betaproteobacteria bacterium]